MKYLFVLVFALPLFVSSCGQDEGNGKYCYSFDLRSCAGDVWAKDHPGFDDSKELLNTIKAYLMDQNVNVQRISIDETFHEVVCQACVVCPQGSRVYIRTSEESMGQLVKLELLSLDEADCGTID